MLASLMIQYYCVSFTTAMPNLACSKAAEAFLKQSGLESQFSSIESYGSRRARIMVQENVPTPILKYAGSAYYLYTVYQAQKISFSLPTLGLADNVNTTLTPTSGELGFRWSIR